MRKLYINTDGNDSYFLKCDIAKYFQNINHEILLKKLSECGFSFLDKIKDLFNKEKTPPENMGNEQSSAANEKQKMPERKKQIRQRFLNTAALELGDR